MDVGERSYLLLPPFVRERSSDGNPADVGGLGGCEWLHSNHLAFTSSAGAGTVKAQVAAVSNAAELLNWEGPLVVSTPTPTVAAYISVLDAAFLTFATTAPTENVTVVVPAPSSSIFYADQETVNPSAISSLIAAVIANVVSQSGNACTAFIAGQRRKQG